MALLRTPTCRCTAAPMRTWASFTRFEIKTETLTMRFCRAQAPFSASTGTISWLWLLVSKASSSFSFPAIICQFGKATPMHLTIKLQNISLNKWKSVANFEKVNLPSQNEPSGIRNQIMTLFSITTTRCFSLKNTMIIRLRKSLCWHSPKWILTHGMAVILK